MRKIKIFVIAVFAIMLCGCSANGNKEIVGEWQSYLILDQDGTVIGCSEEEQKNFPDAKYSTLSCVVEEDKITLHKEDNTWTGTYLKEKSNIVGSIYNMIIETEEDNYAGVVGVSMTDFSDEKLMVMSLNGYSLYFKK
ncbi:MAG: hypothetical protein PHX08_00415 [Lachnospiraceae bacterium]|nr:hypothetical protein [Lachnospiraceae bacterium]